MELPKTGMGQLLNSGGDYCVMFSTYVKTFYSDNDLSVPIRCGWEAFSTESGWNEKVSGLNTRYPGRDYIPLLFREDSDDILCVRLPEKLTNDQRLICVHDYADAGWEEAGTWSSYSDWMDSECGAG